MLLSLYCKLIYGFKWYYHNKGGITLKRNTFILIMVSSFVTLLASLAIFTLLYTNKDKTIDLPEEASPVETDENNEILEVNKVRLKLAYEGRMDYTKEIIGENAEQYIRHPAMFGYLVGGLVISDDSDRTLFTNGYFDADNNVVAGDVVMISKDRAYGINSGMTMEEVEGILGEPDMVIDYSSEAVESELFGTNTCAYYETGDYEVIIEYDRWVKTVMKIYLSGLKNNPGIPTAEKADIDFLELTDEELEIYKSFKNSYNEEVLRGVEPLSIMKLYIHANREKDNETEWELYTKEENHLSWDKEYHMNIPDEHRVSNFTHFENPINIRITCDDNDGVITWEDKYLEEYDGNGYPFRYGFSLVKGKDGIWKVAFMPMQ